MNLFKAISVSLRNDVRFSTITKPKRNHFAIYLEKSMFPIWTSMKLLHVALMHVEIF